MKFHLVAIDEDDNIVGTGPEIHGVSAPGRVNSDGKAVPHSLEAGAKKGKHDPIGLALADADGQIVGVFVSVAKKEKK